MGRAMVIIEYADQEASSAAANAAHHLLSTTVDDLHAVLRRVEALRALHPSCFEDAGLTTTHDALVAAVMDLQGAIGTSWRKAVR